MDLDETTESNERSERGIRRPLSTDDIDEDNNQSNPAPSSRRQRTEKENGFRQYLRHLVPFIRFQLMDPGFFSSKVIPLEILPPSTSTPLLQLFCHPSIPDQNVLEALDSPKRRDAQSIVFTKGKQKMAFKFPNPPPIVVNKGHSTFLKGTLTGEEAVSFGAKPRSFSEGITTAIRVGFLSPPNKNWTLFLGAWRSNLSTSESHNAPVCLRLDWNTPDFVTMHHNGQDDDSYEKSMSFDWKKEFFSIREIILVLRRVESRGEDDERIQLEANLVFNGKKVQQYHFSYLKDSQAGRGFDTLNWSLLIRSHLEEGESCDFLFQVSDVAAKLY